MRIALIIADKEIREGLRNRWVAAATLLLAALALALAFVGSTPTGEVAAGRLTVTVVSLSSLSIYLLPLIALLLAFDTIVGEAERGTLLLTLAYPVSRGRVIVGKFLGHAAIVTFATVFGFGAAAVAIAAVAAPSAAEWRAFAGLVGSSVLLGWVFLAIAYVISAAVRERSTAAGIAIVVWLFMVLLYDMGLLGLLVATGGQGVVGDITPFLLLANPCDAYRLLTLAGFDTAGSLTGLAVATEGMSPASPLAALVVWTLAPLAAAWGLFKRKEL
ncbi:ABC transporter permease subunit [Shumkonia mesophila]|uniref:ABC transporter permease subunit n=1 Tax=Shumkonia mesophila TaxID=2838854 RepID=UPI0029340EB6|nr:ABC transporter permease subunit [Shumkonia mesophila]